MNGSITQLGLSNYLINNQQPAISFFKHAYKNYTNYVKETITLDFKNGFNFGQTAGFRFDEDGKYGDLVTNIVIAVDLPDISSYTNSTGKSFGYCNGIGNAILQNVYFRIGGNLIDQHSSEWMDIWSQLTVKSGCAQMYNNMIHKYDDNSWVPTNFQGGRVYIPLQFWFCKNVTNKNSALHLPLLTLFNSTIDLTMDVRSFLDLIVSEDGNLTGAPTNLKITKAELIVDYVIFEEEERDLYLKLPKQMYIMNQLQTYSFNVEAGSINKTFTLKTFKYPIIELLFVFKLNSADTTHDYFNYSNSLLAANKENPIETVRLMFDGRDRIKEQPASILSELEPAKVHTNSPVNQFIHCYSFSLDPEKIEQPDGVCNFSDLQEPLLHLKFKPNLPGAQLYIFAINYNVLITEKGTGWLLHNLSKATPKVFPECSS